MVDVLSSLYSNLLTSCVRGNNKCIVAITMWLRHSQHWVKNFPEPAIWSLKCKVYLFCYGLFLSKGVCSAVLMCVLYPLFVNTCTQIQGLYPIVLPFSLLLSFPLTHSPVLWGRAQCLHFMYTGCGILVSCWCCMPLISWTDPRKKGVCFWKTAFCQHSHNQQLRKITETISLFVTTSKKITKGLQHESTG